MIKRIAITLIVLLAATSVFAGGNGKSCNVKAGKSVELTGTLATTGSGDDAKTVFRVANSDKAYSVCEKTKASILKLSNNSDTLKVTGKVVSCGEGEELLIDSANKI